MSPVRVDMAYMCMWKMFVRNLWKVVGVPCEMRSSKSLPKEQKTNNGQQTTTQKAKFWFPLKK